MTSVLPSPKRWAQICLILLGLCFGLSGCTPAPHDVIAADQELVAYPDYQGVTIPCNIAPLNFMLRGDYDAVAVTICDAEGHECLKQQASGAKVIFDADDWRQLLDTHRGQQLSVQLTARRSDDGQWLSFPAFDWTISPDSIDRYITYRLIEPGYEVWDNVVIEERCLESFDRRLLADGHELDNRCMNCHTHGGDRGQYSFFYVRGENGGTLLNRDGRLRKVNLRSSRMQGGTVYGDWHPSGRFAVYSTNVIIPAFHSVAAHRLEVYDTQSDLCVADFERDSMLLSPLVSNTASQLETFPAFSADGRSIYYCTAPNPCGDTIPSARDIRPYIERLRYSLCRIGFDPATGTFGSQVDTIYNTRTREGSVNFPKCSPDGRYLCFTRSAAGTFPIWHSESTLCLLPLAADSATVPQVIDTQQNGTYHTWSHNSQWLAFASKRSDGQYGRVYFAHIDPRGITKPLVMPQADPEMDDWNLRSYNIPDLSDESMPYGAKESKMLMERVVSEPFK